VKSATEQGIFRVLRLAVVVLAIVAVFALPAFGVAALIVAINR
jgi:preprotein translocase subunit SecE